jgi:hypothetical protein
MTRGSAVPLTAAFFLSLLPTVDGLGQGRRAQPVDPVGLQRLEAQAGGPENVSIHSGTGTPRFIRLRSGQTSLQRRATVQAQDHHQRTMAFLTDYAGLFGVTDPRSRSGSWAIAGESATSGSRS